jgi:signal transduction histidine kinase
LAAWGRQLLGRHSDKLLWAVTAVLFVIAWSTTALTHEVSAALAPAVAAMGTLPLLWVRAAPFLGWTSWVAAGAVIPLGFRLTSDNSFPWQVPAFLVLLALLVAVGVREAPARIGLTFLGTTLAFLAFLPDPIAVGWSVGAAAFIGLGLLLRGLFRSRREAFAQTRRAEAEQARAEAEQDRAILAEERARIARDLHDVAAHRMSMVVVQAQSAQYRLGGLSPEVSAEFDAVAAQAREALNEVRGMLGVLRSEDGRPDTAPQPGAPEVERLLLDTSAAGVSLTWSITGSRAPGPAPAMVLYRVLQESLANATHHAPGAEVRVTIDYGDDVRVRVVSGPGQHRPAGRSRTGGHGIRGMTDRVASVGGELSAGPTAGGGWVVTATLPAARRP